MDKMRLGQTQPFGLGQTFKINLCELREVMAHLGRDYKCSPSSIPSQISVEDVKGGYRLYLIKECVEVGEECLPVDDTTIVVYFDGVPKMLLKGIGMAASIALSTNAVKIRAWGGDKICRLYIKAVERIEGITPTIIAELNADQGHSDDYERFLDDILEREESGLSEGILFFHNIKTCVDDIGSYDDIIGIISDFIDSSWDPMKVEYTASILDFNGKKILEE